MDASFWHTRWAENQIAFHEGAANALLTAHVDRLAATAGDRVFLPLCGKTMDIAWLAGRGLRVVGAELSRVAVDQLFADIGVTPLIKEEGPLTRLSAGAVEVFVGDIFDLTAGVLGPVDAVYDRAALVALPEEMRRRYSAHLVDITAAAPQFMISFAYDQSKMDGPPFSVTDEEVASHYDARFQVERLEARPITGRLLERSGGGTETAWALTPK